MPLVLDGTIVRDTHIQELKKKVESLSTKPHLVIFRVGDDSRSDIYIREKKRRGDSAGISVSIIALPNEATTSEITSKIEEKNKDNSVHGIIVQLPLPKHVNRDQVINSIDPKKDVDGLTKTNQDKLLNGDKTGLVPATTRGILSLLSFYHVAIKGKKVAVLGRSALVGLPTAKLLEIEGSSVTICHSKTENTRDVTKKADVIVVAIGKSELIDETYFGKNRPVIVDVGINPVVGESLIKEKGKTVVGDVDFSRVAQLASAVSPVPGGVGPMTVVSLLENVFSVAYDMLSGQKSNTNNK